MTNKTGACMCGAVRFAATDVPSTFGICHCDQCRRWTGVVFANVEVPAEKITWQGKENIQTVQSSDWAERGWCGKCGTSLYWRMPGDTSATATIDLPIGLFDDPNGFTLSHEIFIDHKPDSYAFQGEGHKKLTRAECISQFASPDEGVRK